MPNYPPPGTYVVTTGSSLTAEEASANLFAPDALVVLVDTDRRGPIVAYTYMVESREAVG